MTRELIYGRNAVREALRGRREVLELWVSERAAASLDWLGEGPRPQIVKERDLTEAAASPDHQGVVAWASPYPYADPWELAGGEMPLLACLDQVTDPRNLGAVIRSAAGAGATGVIVPAHGAAQVTPAVCRSSAGTVEHLPVAVVPNLARYLAEIKRDDLGPTPRRQTHPRRCGRPTSPAASLLSSELKERASVPWFERRATPRSRFRSHRGSSRSTSASPQPCCCTRRGGSGERRRPCRG